VADAEGFDPALLAQGQRDEESKFDQLGYGKVLMKLLPERVVRDIGVPSDGAGVSKRDFFPLGKFIRIFEIQQLVVFVLRQSLPSSLDGALHASIFAID